MKLLCKNWPGILPGCILQGSVWQSTAKGAHGSQWARGPLSAHAGPAARCAEIEARHRKCVAVAVAIVLIVVGVVVVVLLLLLLLVVAVLVVISQLMC